MVTHLLLFLSAILETIRSTPNGILENILIAVKVTILRELAQLFEAFFIFPQGN